jgi:hypothetical protein
MTPHFKGLDMAGVRISAGRNVVTYTGNQKIFFWNIWFTYAAGSAP